MNPRVTVLMPVYNGSRYVLEAVQSILSQSLADFELLVVDDGSTDSTPALLAGVIDPRLRYVKNEENLGLPATLNKGIGLARGEFIARMDGDDIAFPNRLHRQVAFMEANPDVAVCGCGVSVFYTSGETHKHFFPLSYGSVKMEALFNSPVSHPGAMFRATLFEGEAFRYDPRALWVEDYDLFSRILHRHKIVNIPFFLLQYRVSGESITAHADSPERAAYRKEAITNIQRSNLRKIGFNPDDRAMDLHYALSLTARIREIDFATYSIKDIKSYLYTIRQLSAARGFADWQSANRMVGKIFLKVFVYSWRRMGSRAVCSAICSRLLWDGVWDIVALRIDYLLKTKRK